MCWCVNFQAPLAFYGQKIAQTKSSEVFSFRKRTAALNPSPLNAFSSKTVFLNRFYLLLGLQPN